MGIISIKNLIHEYIRRGEDGEEVGRLRAVNDLSLEVEKGDFIAVLGRNGSGKSTLAKHINALLYPTSGKVFVCGNDTEDDDRLLEIRKNAGMVFQNPDNQIIATVVEEDVAFGPENMGVSAEKIRKRVDEALEAVRMKDFAASDPSKLSGGQKQRVAIAGVLAMHPQCILLDEPTAMLDPIGRREIISTMHRLNKEEGMTVILVTHHMDEVTGADLVYVMDSGSIALSGSPAEVFSHVDEIKALGLDVPQAAELAHELALTDGETVLTPEDFVKAFSTRITPEEFNRLARPVHNNKELRFRPKSSELAPVLELKDVSYTYNPETVFQETAVNDINLKIGMGEFVAVIGHTGSGKSTLIQMMNGLLRPDKGVVEFLGEDISKPGYDKKKQRSRVGLVFQYPDHQLFEMTIYKEVAFGPGNLGLDKEEIDRRVREALDLVGLSEDYYSKSPFEVSTGQKKRITIAGVLAMKPDIIILDEPTAGLDPVGRDEILDSIKSIYERTGITVILVSHSMEEVANYADRIVVMKNKHMLYDDTPVNVFRHVKELEESGLFIPQVKYVMTMLKEKGYDVDTDSLTVEAAAADLKRSSNC